MINRVVLKRFHQRQEIMRFGNEDAVWAQETDNAADPTEVNESPAPEPAASPAPPAWKADVDAAASAGHTAWMLVSAALVLFMTVPGLAMFYGGLVRKKNVLGVMMQCIFLMGLLTVIWGLYGYSLAFGGTPGDKDYPHNPYIGTAQYLGRNVSSLRDCPIRAKLSTP